MTHYNSRRHGPTLPPSHTWQKPARRLIREEDSSWRSEGYSGPSATSGRLQTWAGACEYQARHQLLAGATQAELGGFHRLLGFPNRDRFSSFPTHSRRFIFSYLT